jgi:hypothetical protein
MQCFDNSERIEITPGEVFGSARFEVVLTQQFWTHTRDEAHEIVKAYPVVQSWIQLGELADYLGAVEKFDTCRAALANAVERLGGQTDTPDPARSWHEHLIRELDRMLDKRASAPHPARSDGEA